MEKINMEKLALRVSLEGPLRDLLDYMIERPSLGEFVQTLGVVVKEVYDEDFDFQEKAKEVYDNLRSAERAPDMVADHARMDQRTRLAILFLPAVRERTFDWGAVYASVTAAEDPRRN